MTAFCAADSKKLHPATRKTGYCDVHHDEYERIRRRWKSARNNYRRGASSREPLPFPEYLAQAAHEFSRTDLMVLPLTDHLREVIADTRADLNRSVAFLTKVLANPDSAYKPSEWRNDGLEHIEVVRHCMELLDAIHSGDAE